MLGVRSAASPGPAVVAVGYNRPAALLRLLRSLAAGTYPNNVPLIISLDFSGDPRPGDIADAFDWPHGPKHIIRHPKQLGLREHILSCGDLSQEYGGIILFEDDVVAARHHYDYVMQAIASYGNDERIGGFGLYSYRLNEFNNMDFEPIDDGSDVYFLQVAASWGQSWTAAQWRLFRTWYGEHSNEPICVLDRVPRQLEAWRENSWKRFYIKYLTATGRTFVFPRPSLATNTARAGTNTKRDVSIYQTPLDQRPRLWRMPSLDASLARYDVFYEPDPAVLRVLCPLLEHVDFDVDLFGTKPAEALSRPYLLSSRPAKTGLGFGLMAGAPPVGSILQQVRGQFFTLGLRQQFGPMTLKRKMQLIGATQVGRVLNNVMFQLLKPVQTEMMIRKARRRAGRRAHG